MKALKIRNLLAVGLFALMMMATTVRPAAAQTFTPVPMGCYFQGKTYPGGTVLHFVIGGVDVYMRCELKLQPFPGGLKYEWVHYSSNPS